MIRQPALLVPLLAIAVGCGKKATTADSGQPEPAAATAAGESKATYAIKVRDEAQEGEKHQISKSQTIAITGKLSPEDKQPKTLKGGEKFEYTQVVVTMPAGSDQPTKLTRTYKIAEQTEPGGKTKPYSFQGKTVTFEKKGAKDPYAIKTGDGKTLPEFEAFDHFAELNGKGRLKLEILLPKSPVKVGESWSVDRAGVQRFAGEAKMNVDLEKSRITGKLKRVHDRDGHPWGEIEWQAVMETLKPKGPQDVAATFTCQIDVDVPIDGSAYSGSLKMQLKSVSKGKTIKGEDDESTFEMADEKKATPVK